MNTKQVRGIAKQEVRAHEQKMHKGVKGMKKGGPTSEDMKSVGRNLARVANQKSG